MIHLQKHYRARRGERIGYMKKEFCYTISKKTPYLWMILVAALVLIIVPVLLGLLLSSAPICVFGFCGIILLIFFLYEYFYTKNCRIVITRQTVEIKTPFFNQTFNLYDIHWQARSMGMRGGYHVDIMNGDDRLIRIHLGWDHVEHVLLLRHREPASNAEREVMRLLRHLGE